jgi:hypothetical protein
MNLLAFLLIADSTFCGVKLPLIGNNKFFLTFRRINSKLFGLV